MNWKEEYNQRNTERYEAQRAQDAAYAAVLRPGMPPLPVRALVTEYEELEEIGGPADLEVFGPASEVRFEIACGHYPERQTLEALMPHTGSLPAESRLTAARRHWPWVAHALRMYKIPQKYHDPDGDMKPSKVVEVLAMLRADAVRLERNLNKIERACSLLRDSSQLTKEGHLNYLEGLLAQAVAGKPALDLDEGPERFANFSAYRDWRF